MKFRLFTSSKKIVITFAAVIVLLASSSAAHAQRNDKANSLKDGRDGARNAGVGMTTVVEVTDSASPWLGFMNVSELPENGGAFVFGSGWGIPDLVAEFDDGAGDLTLKPNSVDDPNEFWYQGKGTNPGGPGAPGNKNMEANCYQEFINCFPGQTVTLNFVVTADTLTSAHTARAFIRDFNFDYSSSVDTFFDIPGTGVYSISLVTSSDLAFGNIQYGFQVEGVNVWITDVGPFGSVTIDTVPTPPVVPTPLSTFSSDFEDLMPCPQFSPIGGGWLFAHNQPTGGDYFGDAPQGPQISNLADELGDPGASAGQWSPDGMVTDPDGGGNQYLNIYSDYNNPDRIILPFDFVNNVYQEQTFTAADAAKAQTYTFSFDYAGGQDPFGVAGDPLSTAAGFIRVFDGSFNELANVEFDTSLAPSTPMGTSPTIVFDSGKVLLTMDPAWTEGGIIQFGFTTTSSGFEPTGVFYDNVSFGVLGDANNDGEFNNLDIASFVLALTSLPAYQAAFPEVDPNGVLDMNCDGVFDNTDIADFVLALTGGEK